MESESEYSVSEPASNWYGEPPRDGETERGETDAERGETDAENQSCAPRTPCRSLACPCGRHSRYH